MTFSAYLQQRARRIDQRLFELLENWKKQYVALNDLVPLLNAFIESCKGGKRLRAALVVLGYELGKKGSNHDILQPAIAFEIFQTAILAHDDIIDKSPIRRGKPSLHFALGGDDYGVSQAISLGDLGFFLATQLIAESNFPSENKNRALGVFSKTLQQTAAGEILDVLLPKKKSIIRDDILTIAKLKTASYSFVGPLLVGSTLAGFENKNLLVFGENLGIAYQIQDDILGIFGSEKTLGKSNTSDIQEGKVTLLLLYAQEYANNTQQKKLTQLYGKKDLTKSEKKEIEDVFTTTGAYAYATSMMRKYADAASVLIPTISKDSGIQALLKSMISFLLERKK